MSLPEWQSRRERLRRATPLRPSPRALPSRAERGDPSVLAGLTKEVDLLMVFGGDGTMLRITREAAGSLTPILGINAGGLGFLTDVSSDQLPLALKQIWAGEVILEARPLIEASRGTPGQPQAIVALNDFVITRGAAPRLIELGVSVDDEALTPLRREPRPSLQCARRRSRSHAPRRKAIAGTAAYTRKEQPITA